MTRSILLSVKAVEPSPAPDVTFLFNNKPWIMGVLNATPDSFYTASRVPSATSAVALAETMVQEGVDIVDLGGESTRPGAEEISAATELDRILPLLRVIRRQWPQLPISIDTQKAEVARHALAQGANVINDISAFRHDPAMADVVAQAQVPVVLMHMQGTPQTMQKNPHYQDVIDEIKAFFEERLAFATRHKISEHCVILDPGIGFGKTMEHNLEILRRLDEFRTLGRPILVGASRKSFLGKLTGASSPEERLEGSLAAALWAVQHGAQGVRVHDVGATRRALLVWEGIRAK